MPRNNVVHRIDRGDLRPARKTPDGRLRCDAHIARAGIQEYLKEDGTISRELRDDDEVFAPDSLATFQQLPVTFLHPPGGKVTSENAKKFMVGSTGEQVLRDDDHVRASIMVADAGTIRQMEGGVNQVSCGYTCDVVDKPGIHPRYGRYDARQVNIRGNHVAIVPVARAGETARVRMDSADQLAIMRASAEGDTARYGGDERVRMDAEKLKKELAAALAEVSVQKARADAADEKLATETERADEAVGKANGLERDIAKLEKERNDSKKEDIEKMVSENKTLKERVDAAEKVIAEFPTRIAEGVKARVDLEKHAIGVMGAEFKTDALSDREIMTAVVNKRGGSITNESDAELRGEFRAAVRGDSAWKQSVERMARVITPDDTTRTDSADRPNPKLKTSDAWKQPLPNQRKGA